MSKNVEVATNENQIGLFKTHAPATQKTGGGFFTGTSIVAVQKPSMSQTNPGPPPLNAEFKASTHSKAGSITKVSLQGRSH